MQPWLITLITFWLLSKLVSAASDSFWKQDSGSILELPDAFTFKQKVADANAVSVVTWYAHWCPHSKQMRPAMTQATANLANKGINFWALDCGNYYPYHQMCNRFGIDGYPDFYIFLPKAAYDVLPADIKGEFLKDAKFYSNKYTMHYTGDYDQSSLEGTFKLLTNLGGGGKASKKVRRRWFWQEL